GKGVERERVLGAGGLEEVRLGAGGEDDVVAAVGLARGGGPGLGRRVDGGDFAPLRDEALVLRGDAPQGIRDVAGGEHRRRHLVEQRLELVVVVLVDQGDVDAIVLRQRPGTGDAGESAADDNDPGPGSLLGHGFAFPAVAPAAFCALPLWERPPSSCTRPRPNASIRPHRPGMSSNSRWPMLVGSDGSTIRWSPIGSSPSIVRSSSSGAPVDQACGLQAVGYFTGYFVRSRS